MSDENTETTKDVLSSPSVVSETASACEEKSLEASSSAQIPTASSASSPLRETKSKIDVLLKPAGDAPIMKKKKWAVERSKKISWISEFLKKYLKFDLQDSLFLYVNQSFSPSPDTEVGTVFDCFGSDGKLVLHYCRTQAWG